MLPHILHPVRALLSEVLPRDGFTSAYCPDIYLLHAVQICLSILSISILMLRSRTFFTIPLPFSPNLNYAYSAVRTTE